MAGDSGYRALWDREPIPLSGGTVYRMLMIRGWSDVYLQWIMHQAAAASPAANLTVFSAAHVDEELLKDPLDDTNPYWTDETPNFATWAKSPGTTIESDRQALAANAANALMIKLEPLVDLPKFSFLVSTQARGG